MRIQDNRYKVKQFILYVVSKMAAAERLGAVKLNKVLFRADHEALRLLGRKITTYQYQKNKLGPTLYAFKHIVREMEGDQQLAWELRDVGGRAERPEQRPIAKAEPDVEALSPEERAIIDREIERALAATGTQVSDEEHQTAAWFATRTGELINPELTLVEDPRVIIPLSDAEEQRARAALERFRARAGSP